MAEKVGAQVTTERERCCVIMNAAVKANQIAAGLEYLKSGASSDAFDRLCASLQGKPGTFGASVCIGPHNTPEEINSRISGTGARA